jgi:hypothetical protein
LAVKLTFNPSRAPLESLSLPRLFLFTLFFFPSITFGLVPAEIFPFVIIYYVLFPFISYRLIVAGILYSLLVIVSNFGNQLDFVELLRSSFAYINAVLASIITLRILTSNRLGEKFLKNAVLFSISIMTLIGTIQYLGSETLGSYLSYLIPRGSGTELGEGRGVRLIASEPARAGIHYLLIYFMARTLFLQESKWKLLFDAFIIAFSVVIIKAISVIAFILIFYTATYPKFCLSVLTLAIIATNTNGLDQAGSRLAAAATVFSSLDTKLIVNYIFTEGGFRFPSVYAAYQFGFSTFFGGGVGNWKDTIVIAFSSVSDPFSILSDLSVFNGVVRPTAFLAALVSDFGVVGTAILLTSLSFIFLQYAKRVNIGFFVSPITLVCVFSLLFFGDTGDPVVWIALAYAIYTKRSKVTSLSPTLTKKGGSPLHLSET